MNNISKPKFSKPKKEAYSIGSTSRELMVAFRDVPAMVRHWMTFAGVSTAGPDFHFARMAPKLSQLLVTCSGEGAVWVDGVWKPLRRGMAYVTPRGHVHAYRAVPDHKWRCCWVTYIDPPDEPPILPLDEPQIIKFDPRSLELAIKGLYYESSGLGDVAMTERWVRLIDSYVRRAVAAMAEPDHLWATWEKVRADPGRNWSLADLARTAHVSREVLRQWCHASHSRSPLEHVTHLRMNIAADRLQRSGEKIQWIALELGYANPFAFSRAFKRVMGVAPSEFRANELRISGD